MRVLLANQNRGNIYLFIVRKNTLKIRNCALLNLYVYITEMSLPNNACYVLFMIESSFPPPMYP